MNNDKSTTQQSEEGRIKLLKMHIIVSKDQVTKMLESIVDAEDELLTYGVNMP